MRVFSSEDAEHENMLEILELAINFAIQFNENGFIKFINHVYCKAF